MALIAEQLIAEQLIAEQLPAQENGARRRRFLVPNAEAWPATDSMTSRNTERNWASYRNPAYHHEKATTCEIALNQEQKRKPIASAMASAF
ncbi:MAG: hypothetical protein Q8O79_05270, partial [Pseudomonadota bacterium]|nr:hypothetical protein [Pseudomonadota bacterium]